MSACKGFPGRLYVLALCALPVIAMIAPRVTGIAPPVIAILGLAAYWGTQKKLPAFSGRVLAWALLFPALMAASAFWGIAPATSLDRALKTLPVTLSAAILWDLARAPDEKDIALFRRLFPAAVIISGVLIAVELYGHGPLYHLLHTVKNNGRPLNLSLLNRSVVVYLLSAFVAFFCLQQKEEEDEKESMIVALALAFLAGLILFATNSQSAQLGFIVGIVFFALFPMRSKTAWGILAAVIAAVMISTPWLAQYMFHHFAALTDSYPMLKKGYASQRLELWDFVSRRALQRPWFGFGAEATKMIRDFDSAKIYWPTTQVLHPHNFAVQVWIEFGLLGAVIVSLFFADLLRHVSRLEAPAARMGLVLFLVSLSVAATGYGIWQGWWLGMFCLLMGWAGLLLRPAKD